MALRDIVFYTAGIGFLALAKLKHTLLGYSTPKPIDSSETEKCVAYDIHVVESWVSRLRDYVRDDSFLVGKSVLELGPGADLGVGLLLLAKGAANYNACDVNDLATKAPISFYDALFQALRGIDNRTNINFLREQLDRARTGGPSQLNYIVRDDFDLTSAFGRNSIELVFSQAAFEHFDDIETTIAQLSAVCRPGAVIIAEIDLQTHSRWIREQDPNNIYRYSQRVYETFRFRGIPNRVRPYEYQRLFERYGWGSVEIVPLSRLEARRKATALSSRFVGEINQMDYLSVVLCATKVGDLQVLPPVATRSQYDA
jgi:SAM-dependent methyltransferase